MIGLIIFYLIGVLIVVLLLAMETKTQLVLKENMEVNMLDVLKMSSFYKNYKNLIPLSWVMVFIMMLNKTS